MPASRNSPPPKAPAGRGEGNMAAGIGPVGKAGFAPGEAIVRQMFSGLKTRRLQRWRLSPRITQPDLARPGFKGLIAQLEIPEALQKPFRHILETAE